MFSLQEHTNKFGDIFPIKRQNELKGEFAPAWIPGTMLFPDVDGNEAEAVAEHRE